MKMERETAKMSKEQAEGIQTTPTTTDLLISERQKRNRKHAEHTKRNETCALFGHRRSNGPEFQSELLLVRPQDRLGRYAMRNPEKEDKRTAYSLFGASNN